MALVFGRYRLRSVLVADTGTRLQLGTRLRLGLYLATAYRSQPVSTKNQCLISICVLSRGCACYIIQQTRDASAYVGLMLDHRLRCWPSIEPMMDNPNASFTPVRHLCSAVRDPSSVISRPLQSLPFTPIRLSRAVDTDFLCTDSFK